MHTTKPSSTRAPLLQEITTVCCSTRSHSALTRSTSLGSVLMWVLKGRFMAWFYTILFISRVLLRNFNAPCFSSFCFSAAAELQVSGGLGSNLPSLWLCRALRQTIIFCIAICKPPPQMTDILNRMSRPHVNKPAHSWGRRRPSCSGAGWNNICLLHPGIV